MEKRVKIREFRKEDIPACIEIIKETLGEHNANLARGDFWEGIKLKLNEYAFLKRIVACKSKRIIAIAGVYRLVTHPNEFVGICWYGIKPKYQRKGIGSELMNRMEKIARKEEYKFFFVWAAKKAVPFYDKFGFKINKKLKLIPVESRILMTKKL